MPVPPRAEAPGGSGAAQREATRTTAGSWPPGVYERAREPQDPSWAPYVEQAITTYVARHPRAAEFPAFTVACRSSFCELGALQLSEDSWPAWGQFIYDIRRQMQPEFAMHQTVSRHTPTGPRLEAVLGRATLPGQGAPSSTASP
jgi:hypothetical protein